MKTSFIILLHLVSVATFAQVRVEYANEASNSQNQVAAQKEAALEVMYLTEHQTKNQPAYYIDGKHVSESFFKTLNPSDIAKVSVEKGNFVMNNVTYDGKILITTQKHYTPNLITLSQLKDKYVKTLTGDVVFTIDHEIVKEDYDTFSVNQDDIFKVVVDELERGKRTINFIQILTVTKENIDKAKEVLLRGKQNKL